MLTFKEVIRRNDEWQNLKNFAYCTLGVVTLVLGAFVGAFTASLFDVSTSHRMSDIDPDSAYELSLTD